MPTGLKGHAVPKYGKRSKGSMYAMRSARVMAMQQATRKAQAAANAARNAAQNAAAAAKAAQAASAPAVAASIRRAARTARSAAQSAMNVEAQLRRSARLAGKAAVVANAPAARASTRKAKTAPKPKNAIQEAINRGVLSAPTFVPPGGLAYAGKKAAKAKKGKTTRRASPPRGNKPGNTFSLANMLKALGPK